jgi:hypothetical protein
VLAEMGHELQLKLEVRPHTPATTTRGLVKMTRPMIEVMLSKVKVAMLLTMVARTLLLLMLMYKAVWCDWVVIFGIVIRIWLT